MARKIKIPLQTKSRKIIISTEFVKNLERVKYYSEDLFGKTVSDKFIREIRKKISLLSKNPNTNPINRFLEKTEKKTYRIIIHKSYCILYSVTPSTIDVIDIYHSARSPEHIQSLVNI